MYPGRPREHLMPVSSSPPKRRLRYSCSRTSFGNLGKCQACTALEIDILREHKRAQGSKGLAGEEVGLASLMMVSTQKGRRKARSSRYGRFRDTVVDRQPPLSRYRQEQAHRGHRGRGLELSASMTGPRCLGRNITHLRSMSNCRYPSRGREADSLCVCVVRSVVTARALETGVPGEVVMVGIGARAREQQRQLNRRLIAVWRWDRSAGKRN